MELLAAELSGSTSANANGCGVTAPNTWDADGAALPS